MDNFLDDSVKNEVLSSLELTEEVKIKRDNGNIYKSLIIEERKRQLDERSF